MEAVVIKVKKEAVEFLNFLPEVLLEDDYCSTYEHAKRIKDDIIEYIRKLDKVPHYRIARETSYRYEGYGDDLWYSFFKRKSSPRTTWYIFFEKIGNQIIVDHITNNWIEGQYIR